ncbi:MAG: hypothetical protein K2W82_03550 [Candidatus Obscuribacterales bacterium]|nr:hypothetical protein [Candidatus Obscuribacterales bacterium]
MNLKRLSSGILAATILIGMSFALPAESKKWTTDERQIQLMQEINSGQKSGDLTLVEANSLRKDLSHVARKKAKMKFKLPPNSKLTADQEAEIEKDLNKISSDIHKTKLEKRVK